MNRTRGSGASAASWTIPLHVSITLGPPTLEAIPAAAISGAPAALPVAGLAEAARQFSQESLSDAHFNWRAALSLALASKLSYADEATVRSTAIAGWGFQSCEFVEADETQCFVAAGANAVVIAFRGTESLGDWLGNLNASWTTRSYGKVHRGFLAAFQVVEAQLQSALSPLGGRPVLLTGHSLGGALATVAAAEWQGQVPLTAIYTYGQPAVGKGAFPSFVDQHYAGKFFRFVNDDDIVTRVPPTYRHVGRLFHFDEDGDLKNQLESAAREAAGAVLPGIAGSVEDPPMLSEEEFDLLRAQLLARRAEARLSGSPTLEAAQLEGIVPSVSDHDLDQYIAKIAAKAGA
jgi:triacylglycerol lipase